MDSECKMIFIIIRFFNRHNLIVLLFGMCLMVSMCVCVCLCVGRGEGKRERDWGGGGGGGQHKKNVK